MGRKHRVEYEGALYHVIQRGNNREFIFNNTVDKQYLLKRVSDYKVTKKFNLYGYVIMGNHYHMVMQTNEIPLHKIMHGINNAYSKYYNAAHARTGHVFEGRYKAIPIQDEKYLLALLRYVHQNPVRANICKHTWEYSWSSDLYYRKNNNELVDIDLILNILSVNREEAIKMYSELIEQQDTKDYEEVAVIGDENFELLMAQKKADIERKRLDEILIDTGVSIEDFKLIKSGSRKRHLVLFKIEYAKTALENNYTLKEISQNIKLSDTAIYKLLDKAKG